MPRTQEACAPDHKILVSLGRYTEKYKNVLRALRNLKRNCSPPGSGYILKVVLRTQKMPF